MKNEDLLDYCLSLWHDVPFFIYYSVFLVICIGSGILIKTQGWSRGTISSMWLVLGGYVFVLFSSTVFFRESVYKGYDLMPFWSYIAYYRGEEDSLLNENIMNVVVFVPVGLLASLVSRSMNWIKALILGLCISITIEVLQFAFEKGFAELDDVMHNTLGCLLGYGLIRYFGKSGYLCGQN